MCICIKQSIKYAKVQGPGLHQAPQNAGGWVLESKSILPGHSRRCFSGWALDGWPKIEQVKYFSTIYEPAEQQPSFGVAVGQLVTCLSSTSSYSSPSSSASTSPICREKMPFAIKANKQRNRSATSTCSAFSLSFCRLLFGNCIFLQPTTEAHLPYSAAAQMANGRAGAARHPGPPVGGGSSPPLGHMCEL